MADLNLGSFIVKSASVSYVSTNFLAEKPNNRVITDPDWVDPKDGSLPPMVKEFTDKQWLRYCIVDYVKSVCKKGKHKRDRQAAIIENDIFVEE